jgi:hypothetical protein
LHPTVDGVSGGRCQGSFSHTEDDLYIGDVMFRGLGNVVFLAVEEIKQAQIFL